MANNQASEHLYSDAGIITSHKRTKVTIFVYLCRILSIVLIVLGVMALIIGNI
ncbi:MAG: hypothetical protein K5891_11725 [Lachnospiraceae bacterium]|jgi:hypothetical protein|nr:hypothetical protein [Lachnospiraceae bacterium]